MAQCAFESLAFKASAIHATYRILLRSSSIHEPSDPPVRLILLRLIEKFVEKKGVLAVDRAYHSLSLRIRNPQLGGRMRVSKAIITTTAKATVAKLRTDTS